MAQQRTGMIYGKIADEDGNPLPGVTVTLTGALTAKQTTITSDTGIYRFHSLPPAKDYNLRAELEGFKPESKEGVIVVVGMNVEINFTLVMGTIEEEVTVVAVSPTVDTKKTAVGINVTQDILQSLPTARDPWVILQMAPSVIIDRENVGGAESGQQSTFVSKGSTTYNNNVWAMDGIVITDPAAIGASPTYYDFDAFEEMNIVVGGADVTVQTGGVALNLVTRRGGNRVSLGGRFYVTDEKLQAKNAEFVADTKLKEPYFAGINQIVNNKDYGFNLGGPLVKDRVWLWGSFGVQDLKTLTVYGKKDDTLLTNYVAKLNVQIIPQNRFEAFAHIGGKQKWGRSSTIANPEGLFQSGRYHFGSPIFKLQDEHAFGNDLFVSLKFAFSDAGFSLTPMVDLDFVKPLILDQAAGRYYGSQASRYYVKRPVSQYNFLLQYYNDGLFGVPHDVKVGVEYANRAAYTESVYAGNLYYRQHYTATTWDWSSPLDGKADTVPTAQYEKFKRFYFSRGYYSDLGVNAIAGYLSDTITLGRFNLILGLRYDYQTPRINPVTVAAVTDNPAWNIVDAALKDKLDTMLPGVPLEGRNATYDNGVDGPEGGKPYFWGVFSPRLGLTWDMFGDGKTILKASFGTYGDFMGMMGGDWMPYGTSGSMNFWWWDDGDGIVEFPEVYWHNIGGATPFAPYRVFDDSGNIVLTDAQWTNAFGTSNFWSGYDRTKPLVTFPPRTTYSEDSYRSSRATEAMLTLDKEIFTDFSVTLSATYRKYDHFNWGNKFFVDATGRYGFQTPDWYLAVSTIGTGAHFIPETITVDPTKTKWDGDTEEAPGYEWWVMKSTFTADDRTFDPSYPSAYSIYTKRPGRYNDYYGIDLIFNKRLSNKWMFNGSVTLQNQKAHYGEGSYWEPTNIWALDGRDSSAYIGSASGIINQYTNTRWMVKAAGLYQFPFDINVSFNFLAREGWIIEEYIGYVDYTLPNARSQSYSSYLNPFGTNRLPTFFRVDARVEKMIRLGDTGKIWLMADIFNTLNLTTELRRTQMTWGTYYYYGPNHTSNKFVPTPTAYALDAVLFPFNVRFGVRFQF